jgi:predicted lipoprotein with Yx(FWY)xxD motif
MNSKEPATTLRVDGDEKEERVARLALLALVAAAAIAGCGDEDGSEGAGDAATPAETTAKPEESAGGGAKPSGEGATVKVVDSQFGRILADRKGQAYYLFDKEKGARSECYADCATAWPPVITRGTPKAGSGARANLVGTTRRRDGKLQVTYRGRPLYYYEDDSPGRVLCHNVNEFGGLWLVVRATGRPVQ